MKVTGFGVGLDAYRDAMEPLAFAFRPVETAFGTGLSGTSADQAGPVIVAAPLGDGTLELLSYELTSGELIALVARTRMTDLAGWLAVGGEVR